MMSLRKTKTSSTIFRQQYNGQTGERSHLLVLAGSEAGSPLLDLNRLFQMPFEFIFARLQAGICREFDTFTGICTSCAREFDDAYLGHAQRFKSVVSSKYEGIMAEFQSKLGG